MLCIRRKAQVTTFVIVGVVILFIVGTLIYTQAIRKDSGSKAVVGIMRAQHVDQVYKFVESCVKEVVPEGLFLLGAQGGYVKLPADALQTEEGKIAFFFKAGQPSVPSLEVINSQMALFVRENLPKCTDFAKFPGMQITPSQISTESIFSNKDSIVKVKFPLSIAKDGTTSRLDDEYVVKLPVRFRYVYEKAREIVAMEVKDSENIDLVLLLETDLDINIIPQGDNLVYAITDKSSLVEEVPFTLMFANSF